MDFKKPSVNTPLSICYCDRAAIIIVALFLENSRETVF